MYKQFIYNWTWSGFVGLHINKLCKLFLTNYKYYLNKWSRDCNNTLHYNNQACKHFAAKPRIFSKCKYLGCASTSNRYTDSERFYPYSISGRISNAIAIRWYSKLLLIIFVRRFKHHLRYCGIFLSSAVNSSAASLFDWHELQVRKPSKELCSPR